MRHYIPIILLLLLALTTTATATQKPQETPIQIIQSEVTALKAAREIDDTMLEGRLRSIELRLRNVVRDEADRTKDWVRNKQYTLDWYMGLFMAIVAVFGLAITSAQFIMGRHTKDMKDDFQKDINKQLAKAEADSKIIEDDAKEVQRIKQEIAREKVDIERLKQEVETIAEKCRLHENDIKSTVADVDRIASQLTPDTKLSEQDKDELTHAAQSDDTPFRTSLMAKATLAYENEDWQTSLDLWKIVVEEVPSAKSHLNLAYSAASMWKDDRTKNLELAPLAEHHYQKSIDLEPTIVAYYNKACLQALQGNAEYISSLAEAIEISPKQVCKVTHEDPDFDTVRSSNDFKKLMKEKCGM